MLEYNYPYNLWNLKMKIEINFKSNKIWDIFKAIKLIIFHRKTISIDFFLFPR